MIKNEGKGTIYYGMHFYPGLAEYKDGEDLPAYRVYLNEDTLRKMDPTFAARPIFVEHVDDVDPNIDELRAEADGWVVESFYNQADGKHWVKFITVSGQAEKAIKNGFRLSNAYVPKSFKPGGLWNGVSYQKEITDGEYEHLAIVKHPRYEESIILTPDEFKKYNEDKLLELKKIANSKKGEKRMFNFFKRSKVELDTDMSVILPKSKTEISIAKLINDADEMMEKKKDDGEDAKDHAMANMDHMVKMKDGMMKVKDMADKYQAMCDELESMKKKDSAEGELDLKVEKTPVDAEGDLHNLDEEHPESAVHDEDEEMEDAADPSKDEDAKDKALQLAAHEEEEIDEAKKKDSKKKNEYESKVLARIKADKLKNANLKVFEKQPAPVLELSYDRVQRGIQRYGSNN